MKKIPTIEELRKSGHRVRVQRVRPYFIERRLWQFDDSTARLNGVKSFVYHCGGTTTVHIRKPDGTEVRGTSECLINEPFVRKVGTEIAIARALNLPVPQH